jgi:hypothetical protein
MLHLTAGRALTGRRPLPPLAKLRNFINVNSKRGSKRFLCVRRRRQFDVVSI